MIMALHLLLRFSDTASTFIIFNVLSANYVHTQIDIKADFSHLRPSHQRLLERKPRERGCPEASSGTAEEVLSRGHRFNPH